MGDSRHSVVGGVPCRLIEVAVILRHMLCEPCGAVRSFTTRIYSQCINQSCSRDCLTSVLNSVSMAPGFPSGLVISMPTMILTLSTGPVEYLRLMTSWE